MTGGKVFPRGTARHRKPHTGRSPEEIMIIVVKNNPDKKQMDNLVKWIKGLGLDIHMSKGDNSTVMGLIGDTSVVDEDLIRSLDIVESVTRIQ